MQVKRAATLFGFLLAGLLASCMGAADSPTPTFPTASPVSSPTRTPSPTPSPFVSPSPSFQTYVVASGDTFARIAAKFGIRVEALAAANPSIEGLDRISIGDAINIPVDSPTVVVEAAAEGGAFATGYLQVPVGEYVSIRILGDPRWAGEPVEMQVAPGNAQPFVFTDFGGSTFDASGRMTTTELADSSWSTAYRARLSASDRHPALVSEEIVVEWGGSGPCPARVGSSGPPPVVTADGTTYELVPGVDGGFNSQWTIVASNVRGMSDSGWSDLLDICWEPRDAAADAHSSLYVALAHEPGGQMRLLVATPQGIRAEEELWGPFSLDSSPDGTVYASSSFVDDGCLDFRSLSVAAVGPDARPTAGWPFTTTDLTSMPLFGRDGTVYLAQSTDAGDRIVTLGPDGQATPGWPYALPGSFDRHVCEGTPREPRFAPDGSLFDVFDAGIYMVGPDGRARPGWPYLLPTGTSVAREPKDHTPCCGVLGPILTDDGLLYMPRTDSRYATGHDDMMCLLLDGTLCPGWPVRMPHPVAGFEVDEGGTVQVSLFEGIGLGEYPVITVRPDGTVVHQIKVDDTISGIAAAYGVTQVALLTANPQVTDRSLIHPGDVLVIPRLGTEP